MAERVQITGPTDERYVEILSPRALELTSSRMAVSAICGISILQS